jgi:hypothetical protein
MAGACNSGLGARCVHIDVGGCRRAALICARLLGTRVDDENSIDRVHCFKYRSDEKDLDKSGGVDSPEVRPSHPFRFDALRTQGT